MIIYFLKILKKINNLISLKEINNKLNKQVLFILIL